MKWFFIFLLLGNYCLGQIVNGDFENWRTLPTSPVSEDPVGWTSNNLGIIHHYGANAVEKSSDAYSGSWAVKIKQFYDSTSTCQTNFLVYKELVTDTSLYSNNCLGYWLDINTSYDTLSYTPIKVSFYYKTVNFKPSISNYVEFNVIDTTDPFGLPSGQGFRTLQLTPSATYTKKELFFNTIRYDSVFQLIHINFHIKNSYDSAYQNGYILIDNIQFEDFVGVKEVERINDISIYPNPSNHIVNIDRRNLKTAITAIKVFNVNGQIINSYNYSIQSIDVSSYEKGMYFMVFETDKGSIHKKIIVN